MKEHPQAEILRAIADGKTIEHRYKRIGWMSLSPSNALRHVLADGNELRIKPVTVTINGHEVPEPVREPLKYGTEYWYVCLDYEDGVCQSSWDDSDLDRLRLERGLIHMSESAVVCTSKALLSFTRSDK